MNTFPCRIVFLPREVSQDLELCVLLLWAANLVGCLSCASAFCDECGLCGLLCFCSHAVECEEALVLCAYWESKTLKLFRHIDFLFLFKMIIVFL
jgi:hypothetical protein